MWTNVASLSEYRQLSIEPESLYTMAELDMLEMIRARIHDQANLLQTLTGKIDVISTKLDINTSYNADHETRIRILEAEVTRHHEQEGHPVGLRRVIDLEQQTDKLMDAVSKIHRRLALWAGMGSAFGALVALLAPAIGKLIK